VALVVAGLAITQLLPPFSGIPGGRHIVGVPLIVLGIVLSLASYRRWEQNQRALRLGQPLPSSNLPRLLTVLVAAVALIAAVLVLLTRGSDV
jgi:putative membrane protein